MENDIKNNETLILFENADILNGETKVIFGMNMSVSAGDFVYIIGKVGTGKSSVIKTLIAENRLGGGKAVVCGYDLATIKSKEIPFLRRKMGVVFQDFQLLMDRSVRANLEFVLKATGWEDKTKIAARIGEVLSAVGMVAQIDKMPFQLSGGEQQRVAIARALLNNPEVIVADEPTGNLDEDTATGIMDLISKINKERKTAVVMVTHNTAICDRYPGRVMLCGAEKCTEI